MMLALKLLRAPTCLGLLVGYLVMSMPPGTFPVNNDGFTFAHTELFAGDRAVTSAWQDAGFPAAAMDTRFGTGGGNAPLLSFGPSEG